MILCVWNIFTNILNIKLDLSISVYDIGPGKTQRQQNIIIWQTYHFFKITKSHSDVLDIYNFICDDAIKNVTQDHSLVFISQMPYVVPIVFAVLFNITINRNAVLGKAITQ